jgi:hypothetical protein
MIHGLAADLSALDRKINVSNQSISHIYLPLPKFINRFAVNFLKIL